MPELGPETLAMPAEIPVGDIELSQLFGSEIEDEHTDQGNF